MKKKITLIIALVGMSFYGNAQTYSVKTDGTGKIIDNLPELIFNNNNINFKVADPNESFALYEKMLAGRAKRSKRQLTKLLADGEKMDILKKVYNILTGDINSVIAELNIVIANRFASAQTHIPVYTAADKKYFSVDVPTGVGYFAGPVQNDKFEVNTASASLAITSTAGGEKINFSLSKTEPFKKITYNWLSGTKSDYSGSFNPEIFRPLHEQVTAKIKKIKNYLQSIDPLLSKAPNYVAADIPALKAVSINAVSLIAAIDADNFIASNSGTTNLSAQYKDWVLKWLWYQSNYMPALNPFNFKIEGDIGSDPDTSKLELLRLQIQAREDFYKGFDIKKTTPAELDKIIAETEALRKEKAAIERAAKNFATSKANNDKAILDFGNTSELLNEGLLVAGKDKGSILFWQLHHDASNNFQLLNDNVTDEYREDDRVIILSHNLKPGETAKANLSFKDITNDASQLSDEFAPLIDQLTKAAGAFPIFGGIGFSAAATLDKARNEANGRVQELLGKVKKLQAFDKTLEYLMQQSNPVLDITETVDKSSSYHSQLSNPAKKIYGPKKATYYMTSILSGSDATTTKDKPIADTFTYRVNKLYRIFPMAGAFYTTNKFVEINEGKINELQHIRFVIGLKVYFKKTDIRNTKFFTDKDEHNKPLWKSRTSMQLAFDVQKPLRNIYLGAGLDLWPGFCISAGAVANKYIYSEFNNGVVVRTRDLYRPGGYLGFSTDISLFTDLVKFLNLSK